MMRRTYYGQFDHTDRITERKNRRVAAARARQVRRQKLLLIIGVLVTLALCSFFSIKAFANTDPSPSEGCGIKKYRSMMIYCGDSVDTIAEDNYTMQFSSVGSMADEIRSINHIQEEAPLIPGNYIIIPYYDMSLAN